MRHMISRLRLTLLMVSLSLFSSCSTLAPSQRDFLPGVFPSPPIAEQQTLQSEELPDPSQLETIVILGTNDIHGTLISTPQKSREAPGVTPVNYEFGGVAMISAYAKKLKAEHKDHFIWLDGGDQFQGSIESNSEIGKPMVDFFNASGLTASAVGNHDFDFSLAALKTRAAEARYPYLAANVRERNTGELAPFPNTSPSQIFKVGKLNVGVIGLTTEETPTTTRSINVKTLTFENLKNATLRESQILRNKGANIVLITAHAGTVCDAGGPNLVSSRVRKPTDPQGLCNDQDEMVRLLKAIPPGTVDAVVSGHTHTVVHHWIGGVPVIQGGAFGRYLNLIHLTYDWSRKKVRLDQTRIEGPIPVCPKVFENQQDCDGTKPAPKGGRGPLVPTLFHGEVMHPDPAIVALIDPVLKRAAHEKNRVIGFAARPLEHRRLEESELGDVIADAMRRAAKTDVAFMNPGGVRAPIEMGPITFGAAFRSLPFDNDVAIIQLTGAELKTLIQVAQNGHKGFGSISGLRLRLIATGYDAPFEDLDNSGRHELWKTNRLLDIKLADGSPLIPDKMYSLATSDFLITGGDDFGWPMTKIPTERKNLTTGILAREALVSFIQASGPLNTVEHPIIDPQHPRLSLEKPKNKGGAHHRKSRRHHKISNKPPRVEKNNS
jgi:5'-nucleotidase